MIDVVYGNEAIGETQRNLVVAISSMESEGTFYIGYPVLTSSEGAIQIDALLVSKRSGLVAFDLSHLGININGIIPEKILDYHDRLFAAINSKLSEERRLVHRRQLIVDISIITISEDVNKTEEKVFIRTVDQVRSTLERFENIPAEQYKILNSVIERTTTLKPRKARADLKKDDSRGSILKLLESKIANLDGAQKKAAIEFPDGPQRIRGLAGTGKTIVLAMKASYLHLKNPHWNIALTFYTRSLYQQITGLVRRFSF